MAPRMSTCMTNHKVGHERAPIASNLLISKHDEALYLRIISKPRLAQSCTRTSKYSAISKLETTCFWHAQFLHSKTCVCVCGMLIETLPLIVVSKLKSYMKSTAWPQRCYKLYTTYQENSLTHVFSKVVYRGNHFHAKHEAKPLR